VDYVHKRKFPTLGPILTWTLRVTSLAVGVGIYQFNTNDVGTFVMAARMPVCIQLNQIFRRSDGAHPPRMDCIGVSGRGIVSLP
jgi:CybS, succinate dehydrogenase cytochrome B small subunit